jgi:antitoxin (DNA-binding transcriptional repressor) of toxin-antitoxin stability system
VKTLSVSQATKDLGDLVARALKGEEVGIECNGRVIALRPVEEEFEDVTAEYGLTPQETERAFDSLSKAVRTEKQTGRLTRIA